MGHKHLNHAKVRLYARKVYSGKYNSENTFYLISFFLSFLSFSLSFFQSTFYDLDTSVSLLIHVNLEKNNSPFRESVFFFEIWRLNQPISKYSLQIPMLYNWHVQQKAPWRQRQVPILISSFNSFVSSETLYLIKPQCPNL